MQESWHDNMNIIVLTPYSYGTTPYCCKKELHVQYYDIVHVYAVRSGGKFGALQCLLAGILKAYMFVLTR